MGKGITVTTNDDDQPFKVQSPTRVTLSPVAREWARAWGMTETEMAKHLLEQERLRTAGDTQQAGEN